MVVRRRGAAAQRPLLERQLERELPHRHRPGAGRLHVHGGPASTRSCATCTAPACPAASRSRHPGADPLESVLVFSKTAGFRHDSIPAGIAAIQQLGTQNDFTVDGDRGQRRVHRREPRAVRRRSSGSRPPATSSPTPSRTRSSATSRPAAATSASTRPPTPSTTWTWYGQHGRARYFNEPPDRHADRDGRHRRRRTSPPPSRLPGPLDAHGRVVQLPVAGQPGRDGGGRRLQPAQQRRPRARDRRRDDLRRAATTAPAPTTTRSPGAATYDGGRCWYTGDGPHRRPRSPRPTSCEHVLGGLQTAAGAVASDCGAQRAPTPEPERLREGHAR